MTADNVSGYLAANGDLPGHEFRGNQWTDSDNAGLKLTDSEAKRVREQIDALPGVARSTKNDAQIPMQVQESPQIPPGNHWTDIPVSKVKIEDLHASQEGVWRSKLKSKVQSLKDDGWAKGESINVIRHSDGSLQVWDGHHRLSVLRLAGRQFAPVRVWSRPDKQISIPNARPDAPVPLPGCPQTRLLPPGGSKERIWVDSFTSEAFRVVIGAVNEAPALTPNLRAAADKVLQGAALAGVGRWMEERANDRILKLERDLVGLIRGTDGIELVLRSANRLIEDAFADITRSSDGYFHQLSDMLAKRSVATLHVCHGAKCNHGGKIDPAQTLIMGATLKECLAKMADDLKFRFKAEMRQGKQADESADAIVERVIGTPKLTPNETLELVANATVAAPAVTRRLLDSVESGFSKTIQAAVQALSREIDDLTADEVDADDQQPMGWQWVAVLDDRICDQCASLEGSQWDSAYEPVGDGEEFEQEPPLHYNCRCQLVPVDLSGDPIPRKTKLDVFVKARGRKAAEAVWGKAASDAYHDGKLSASELLGAGRPLSPQEFADIESVMNP